MPLVIPLTDLGLSPTAALFEGRKRADVDVSFFVTDHPPGGGPDLHKHPYPEVFVVQEGEATFTVNDEQMLVREGNVVAGREVGAVSSESPTDDTTTATTTPATATAATAAASMAFFTKPEATLAPLCENRSRSS